MGFVITALPTFRHEGKPFLAFVCTEFARTRWPTRTGPPRGRPVPISVADVPDAPSTERGPEQRVVANFDRRWPLSTDILGTLPETQQEILRLRVVVGLSAEETAEALGMTAGAVRVSTAPCAGQTSAPVVRRSDASLTEQLV